MQKFLGPQGHRGDKGGNPELRGTVVHGDDSALALKFMCTETGDSWKLKCTFCAYMHAWQKVVVQNSRLIWHVLLTRYLVGSRKSEPLLPLLQNVSNCKKAKAAAKCCKYLLVQEKVCSLQLKLRLYRLNTNTYILKRSGSNTNLGDNALLYEAPSTGITINVFDNHRAF